MTFISGIKFRWDTRKDSLLRQTRNIGFQDIVNHLHSSSDRYIEAHTNIHYSHQILIIAYIKNYPYVVPSILLDHHTIKLVTIFPDRKHKKYFTGCL